MAFDQNKPANNGTMASVDMRNNFIHIKNAVDKEHVWDDANPANTTHRLDQIKGTVTGFTQKDTASGGFDYQTGAGNTYSLITHSVNGVAANTYTLQSLLQELVNRSHQHIIEKHFYNCNCDCNCDCCFVAGSKVLMGDWTWKNIENVQIGDKVLGIDGKSNTITAFVRGYTTKMGKLDSIGLDDLYFTISHNFWVQYGDKQVWGSNDKALHLTSVHDAMLYDSYDIKDMTLPYATIYGWNSTRVQKIGNVKPTEVFNFKVSGSHSYIVNGYVVSGCACEYNDFDWSAIDWKGLENVAN